MINHFNFKRFGSEYLLTNDFGLFAFVSKQDLRDLVTDDATLSPETRKLLKDNLFIVDEASIDFTSENLPRLRGMKRPLFSAASLHILVMTTACNLNCVYCQAHGEQESAARFMNKETVKQAIDIALDSPSPTLTFEFQGGEPLLNFPVMKYAIEYANANRSHKSIRYTVVTNLSLLTDEMVEFFSSYHVDLSTSLDGHKLLHDANRPFRNGDGSYRFMEEGLKRARLAGLNVGGIQTTTRESLGHANEIVNTYCDLGFTSIFIRPLTPLGVARVRWDSIGYTAQEFGEFYRDAMRAILKKNEDGIPLREGHASILLEKLFFGNGINYMELRSPCGAGVGQLAYHVDGNVFTCDEGRMLYEMGDPTFRLGNVGDSEFSSLLQSPVCRVTCAASTLETIPGCCDCAYQPYCGVCPVVNMASEADLIPKAPHNYRCGVYSEIFDTVFGIIRNTEHGLRVLRSWFDEG